MGDHLRGQGLSRPGVSGEQRGDPLTAPTPAAKPPVVEDSPSVGNAADQVVELLHGAVVEHDVVPAGGGHDTSGQPFQPRGVLRPRAECKVGGVEHLGVGFGCGHTGVDGSTDLLRPEPERVGWVDTVGAGRLEMA